MVSAGSSGCINHPGVEAAIRCKQCGRPVCGACIETGPTGRFCSTNCRDQHQAFIARAQQLEGRSGTGLFTKLKSLLNWLIIAVVVLAVIGFVSTLFYIPVISDLTVRVRGFIGL